MARMIFLFSPVFFSGLVLLVGETIYWIKKGHHAQASEDKTILVHGGRE